MHVSNLCFAGLYIREDGVVIDATIVDEVRKVVTAILQDCEQYASGCWGEDAVPKSVGQHLRQKFECYLDGCAEDSRQTRCMKEELFDWHVRYLLPSMTVLYFIQTQQIGMYLRPCILCFKCTNVQYVGSLTSGLCG
jgi:hypothetical protein